MNQKLPRVLWMVMLALALVAAGALAPACSCGDDDDDDDDDAADDDAGDDDADDDDADDDDADDDDADDDDADDDDADDDDADDDTGDDDIAADAISGFATDFKEGTPLAGATVEAVDDTTGLSFDPAISATAGSDGYVLLEGIPQSKGAVAIKVSLNGYKDTYQYHFQTGVADNTFLGVSNTVVTLVSGLLGITPDPSKGFASGAVYYIPETGDTEPVGCAEVTFSPAVSEVHYFKESVLGVLPTDERDTDGNGVGDENGKGTNPALDGEGDPMSFFVGVNADPGAYTITADIDGEQETATIPALFADSVAITRVEYREDDGWTENPTAGFCTN
ncbi:carboxypeptidase-like regulatory domain-containing protein [bacterium]|nr:carboxypeptidase-like regulatory domain-containing protein [bacterium]